MKRYIWEIIAKTSVIMIKTKFLAYGVISVRFNDFFGFVVADYAFRYPEINIQIYADSLSALDQGQDEKLKSSEYYAVKEFPIITFESVHGCKFSGGGIPELTGYLTIKGIKRAITLISTYTKIDPPGRRPAALFHFYCHANYRDWQVGSDQDKSIGDTILLTVELLFVKKRVYRVP